MAGWRSLETSHPTSYYSDCLENLSTYSVDEGMISHESLPGSRTFKNGDSGQDKLLFYFHVSDAILGTSCPLCISGRLRWCCSLPNSNLFISIRHQTKSLASGFVCRPSTFAAFRIKTVQRQWKEAFRWLPMHINLADISMDPRFRRVFKLVTTLGCLVWYFVIGDVQRKRIRLFLLAIVELFTSRSYSVQTTHWHVVYWSLLHITP